MFNKQLLIGVAGGALGVAILGAAAFSFAATTTSSSSAAPQGRAPGVAGTVTAVSGDTITLTGKNGTVYTINAGSASITKDETVTVSDIAVGDTITAQGTLNGTTVAATSIHDGKLPAGGFGRGLGGPGKMGIRGNVTAINGTTLTVSATSPQGTASIYSVDASGATVLIGNGSAKPASGSLSSVKVGDTVMIAGTLSGQNVTAKMIFDGPMPQWGKKPSTSSQ